MIIEIMEEEQVAPCYLEEIEYKLEQGMLEAIKYGHNGNDPDADDVLNTMASMGLVEAAL